MIPKSALEALNKLVEAVREHDSLVAGGAPLAQCEAARERIASHVCSTLPDLRAILQSLEPIEARAGNIPPEVLRVWRLNGIVDNEVQADHLWGLTWAAASGALASPLPKAEQQEAECPGCAAGLHIKNQDEPGGASHE